MIRCANCGNSNPDDNNFCDQCGQPLVKVMTEDVDSTEYANNPFKSNESSTTQNSTSQQKPKKKTESKEKPKPQPKKTIKKCSNCGGSGNIKEEVQSLFGKTYKLTNCPKCLGAGKYYVDENGKFMGVLKKTLSNSNPAQSKSKPALSSYEIAVLVCVGIIIFIGLSALGRSNKSTQSSAISQDNIEVSTGPTLDVEVASYSYRDLYFEIPKSWESKQISGAEMYFEDPEEGYCIAGEQGDKSSDFEFTKLMIKSNYNEQLQNGECTSVDYEDCTFAGLDAYKVTLVQNNAIQYIYAFNSDSGLYLICLLCPSSKEADFQPIMDYILNSTMLVNPDDVESTIVNTETLATTVTEESTTVTTEETTTTTTEATTESTSETTTETSNKYAYYGNDTYYIIDLDKNKVYNFFTYDTDPYVGSCSGDLSSGLTVTYNLDGDYVTETIYWSGSGDSQICVIDSYGFDWYYNKTSYSSAAAVMD